MFLEMALVLAMQDSTTTCRPFGGQVTCNTTQNGPTGFDAYTAARDAAARAHSRPSGPPDAARCAGSDWFLVGCTLGAHREAVRVRDARSQQQDARGRAMGLLRSGDCQGAVSAALDTGDLAFATEVRTFCAAGPAPAQ